MIKRNLTLHWSSKTFDYTRQHTILSRQAFKKRLGEIKKYFAETQKQGFPLHIYDNKKGLQTYAAQGFMSPFSNICCKTQDYRSPSLTQPILVSSSIQEGNSFPVSIYTCLIAFLKMFIASSAIKISGHSSRCEETLWTYLFR